MPLNLCVTLLQGGRAQRFQTGLGEVGTLGNCDLVGMHGTSQSRGAGCSILGLPRLCERMKVQRVGGGDITQDTVWPWSDGCEKFPSTEGAIFG
jgi:hypothetical protein